MNESGSRRAVAEIRFGEDRIGITKVSGRSIHQYWTLLGPHFRDVLLAPQRRSDDGGVAWTWREAADKKPLTAAELAGVRKRLERAKESFEENPVSPLMGEGRTGTSSQALIDQVAAKVKSMAEALTAKPDVVLANFVCRTETGVMVHSWGVASAAPVIYPDSLETGVSGVVVVAGKPVANYEVVIENAKGLSVARMQSDESGEFHFSKIGPGRYRVRVVSGKGKFPAKGVMVTVERGAVARIELRSDAESDDRDEKEAADEAAVSATETSPGARGSLSSRDSGGRGWLLKTAGALLILLLLAGGGVWAWRTWSTPDETKKPVAVRSSSMAPEDFSAGQNSTSKARHSNLSSAENAGLGAAADGTGGAVHRPGTHSAGTEGRHTSAVATGSGYSPATIGSKIEVLSGAADERGADEKNTDDNEAPSIAGGAGAQESVSDRANAGANVGATDEQTTASRKKNSGKAAAASSVSGRTTKAGGGRPGEAEAVTAGNENLLPEEKTSGSPVRIPAGKKAATRPPPGAVSVGEHPADGEAVKDEVSSPGPTPAEVPPDEVTVGKPDGGLPPANAPIAKVSVVNKGPATGNVPGTGAVFENDGAAAAENAAPALAGKATRRSKGTPGVGTKSGQGGAPTAEKASEGPSQEPNDTAQTASEAAQNPAGSQASPSEGNGGNVSPDNKPEGANAESADAAKNGVASTGNGKPVVAKIAPVGPLSTPKNKTIANRQHSLPGDAQENNSPAESSADLSAAIKSGGVPADEAVEPDVKTVTVEVGFTRWEPRLLADAIVPTLPVRVGAVDAADQTRDGMLAEQKARVPVTFRHPVARCGFAFELPAVSSGRSLFWQDSAEAGAAIKTMDGGRAEISWIGEKPPRGSRHVLKFADGREAVRLTIKEDGGVVLKVTAGVRARAVLMVKRSVSDDSGQTKSGPGPRFSWQVNGGASASKENSMDPILGNQDHRLGIPLELSKGNRTEIALTDRITGWALVTRIQLQPVP
jgi:hypothetical protein